MRSYILISLILAVNFFSCEDSPAKNSENNQTDVLEIESDQIQIELYDSLNNKPILQVNLKFDILQDSSRNDSMSFLCLKKNLNVYKFKEQSINLLIEERGPLSFWLRMDVFDGMETNVVAIDSLSSDRKLPLPTINFNPPYRNWQMCFVFEGDLILENGLIKKIIIDRDLEDEFIALDMYDRSIGGIQKAQIRINGVKN